MNRIRLCLLLSALLVWLDVAPQSAQHARHLRLSALLFDGQARNSLAQRDPPPPDRGAVAVIATLDDLDPTDQPALQAASRLDFIGLPLEPGRLHRWYPGDRPVPLRPLSEYSPDLLRRFSVCQADTIVIGRVVARRVFINRSRTALLTMNDIAVLSRIHPAEGPHTLQVVVVGGRAIRNGEVFETPHSQPRIIVNADMLLLLRMNGPPDGFYLASDAHVISDGVVTFQGLSGQAHEVVERLKEEARICPEVLRER
jgi:hypothetical protein